MLVELIRGFNGLPPNSGTYLVYVCFIVGSGPHRAASTRRLPSSPLGLILRTNCVKTKPAPLTCAMKVTLCTAQRILPQQNLTLDRSEGVLKVCSRICTSKIKTAQQLQCHFAWRSSMSKMCEKTHGQCILHHAILSALWLQVTG